MSLQNKVIYYILTGARKSNEAIQNIKELRKVGADVYAILSKSAMQFVNIGELEEASGNFVRLDFKKEKPEHSLPLEDIVIIAPATFNTINKIANGIADTLHTSLIATAIGRGTPIYLAPNVNYDLWRNPILQKNLCSLREVGINVIHPQVEDGKSTMAETLKVLDTVLHDFVRIRFQQYKIEGNQEQIQSLFPLIKKYADSLSNLQVPGSSAGCISVRTANGFVVTTSGSKLGHLSVDDLALVTECDEQLNTVKWIGTKAPSSETPLHYKIYEMRQDINVILHVHTPLLTYSSSLKAYRTKQYYSYGTFDFGKNICSEMSGEKENIIIAKDHGQIAVGNTFEEAFDNIQKLFSIIKETELVTN
ncbi:class II aldolase/adducin family protein [Brevibacillus brevis]|uniref:class II aldolase/adducin family protein n=1 Tax=Brevibacillus brevis TaxID=1393 RepID=UPI00115BAE35|nr:class II aldolase/adducin family protein [Lysinibacillus sp. SDF0063]TQR35775.1 hypothetical protein C7Y45_15720 [Lysinibacillus sp. SDF0063]